jgi:hypothetical protein
MTDPSTLLQANASRERHQQVFDLLTDEELETLSKGFATWGPNFPTAALLVAEIDEELARRRAMASEGE